MKKRSRLIVIIVSVFSLSLLVLAPNLFHKRKITNSNEIIASKVQPGEIPAEEPTRPHLFTTVSDNQLQDPVLKTIPKSLSEDTPPVAKVVAPEPVKTMPRNLNPALKEKIHPKINDDKPLISKTNRPNVELKPEIPKQTRNVIPDSPATTAAPEQPSPWGVVVLASSSGVDGGISYRLVQIPLLKGIDLDLVAGIKQAGLGLSKYVYGNVGLGLTGTVTYTCGDKNLGIYGKYSF